MLHGILSAESEVLHVELSQLKYFKTVAQTGKIAAAARELYLSAPALSTSIARLEKDLGMPLFEHAGNKIVLNAQGEIFLRYVDQVFDTLSCARNELQRSLLQDKHIWLMTTNSHLWVDLISSFSLEYPRFILTCTNLNLNKLAAEHIFSQYTFLLAEEEDLPSAYQDALNSTMLFEDTPAVVVPADHPLAGAELVDAALLQGERLLLPMPGMALRERLTDLLEANGVDVSNATSCSEVFSWDLVRQGQGITFTSMHSRPRVTDGVVMVPIRNNLAPWVIRLYWHKSRSLNEDEQTFRRFVERFYHVTEP